MEPNLYRTYLGDCWADCHDLKVLWPEVHAGFVIFSRGTRSPQMGVCGPISVGEHGRFSWLYPAEATWCQVSLYPCQVSLYPCSWTLPEVIPKARPGSYLHVRMKHNPMFRRPEMILDADSVTHVDNGVVVTGLVVQCVSNPVCAVSPSSTTKPNCQDFD